ncbi:hypothetical protein [Leuconostoc gelidum]|uniref:hypothetical protein n=1 Tax=Leuconostoc gelidum TaxID=1244 RepID=UPI001CC34D8A|nr:hypothetical protein [Leuconostoc gelidum]MBZ6000962.1 hypothetical protein [Leuconostoc gelidum subsp. gelidum]
MTDWNNKRPEILENVSALGIGKAIYAAPDGNKETARLLVAADGFHFEAYDFDDLVLPSITLQSPIGSEYRLSFDDTGALLINSVKYVAPTNQTDETIAGDKQFTGKTDLVGGLKLTSATGVAYDVIVDENGVFTAVKEV